MSIEELKKKFIVDDDALKNRLEAIATKALERCVLDNKGNVHFNDPKLTAREKFRLTLAARAIGAQMDTKIKAEVSTEELVANSGLPKEQVHSRASELIKQKFIKSEKRGFYVALPHKVEALIDSVKVNTKQAS